MWDCKFLRCHLWLSVLVCLNLFFITNHCQTSDRTKTTLVFQAATNGRKNSSSSIDCQIPLVHEFYDTQFSTVNAVPFSVVCLQQLIQNYPHDISLRVMYVRKVYSLRMEENQNQKKYFFYNCSSVAHCGGMGDRIRGMTFSFLMALATDANFGIFIGKPVTWDSFLLPIGKDIDTQSRYLQEQGIYEDYKRNPQYVIDPGTDGVLYWKNMMNEVADLPTLDLNRYFFPQNGTTIKTVMCTTHAYLANPDAVVQYNSIRSKMEFYKLTDLDEASLFHIFLKLYATKLTPVLSQEVNRYLSRLEENSYIVGVHFRLGKSSNSGDIAWSDPQRHSMKDLDCIQQKISDLCLAAQKNATAGKTEKQQQQQPRQCKVWFCSDSKAAVVNVTTYFRDNPHIEIMTSDGEASHPDISKFNNSDIIESNIKTFLDFYILGTRSDALIISASWYGILASFFQSNQTHVNYRPAFALRRTDDPNTCTLVPWNYNTAGYHL